MTEPAPGKPLILIADDHEMVVEMFSLYLGASADMAVMTAKSLEGALDLIRSHGPFDVVLLDLNMPGMNGVAGLGRAILANAGRPVAILTSNPSPRMVEDIMAAGASGIVLKTTPARSLGATLRHIRSGARYLPPELDHDRADALEPAGGRLSDKEMQVMLLLAEGRQNKDIAFGLGLSEPTIKMHVKAICRKLGAANRTQAVINARSLGLV